MFPAAFVNFSTNASILTFPSFDNTGEICRKNGFFFGISCFKRISFLSSILVLFLLDWRSPGTKCFSSSWLLFLTAPGDNFGLNWPMNFGFKRSLYISDPLSLFRGAMLYYFFGLTWTAWIYSWFPVNFRRLLSWVRIGRLSSEIVPKFWDSLFTGV